MTRATIPGSIGVVDFYDREASVNTLTAIPRKARAAVFYGEQGGVAELLGSADQRLRPLAGGGTSPLALLAAGGSKGSNPMDVFVGINADDNVGVIARRRL